MSAQPSLRDALDEAIRAFAGRPALRSRGVTLTFSELAERVAQEERRIIASGCAPGALVAIQGGHDVPTIISMLACVRGDRIALPLDPRIPPAFVGELLAGFGAAVRLGVTVERLDGAREVTDDGTTFVYLTSGSTGRPKGVALPAKTVLRGAANHADALGMVQEDRVALLGSLGFGASLGTIWSALLRGACLCMADPRELGAAGLSRWMKDEGISVYQSVTSLFRVLAAAPSAVDAFASVRVVKLGGEPVVGSDVTRLREIAPHACFVNGLGITEAGGNVCYYRVGGESYRPDEAVPLGYPAPGYSLDIQGGQLVIRSEFLASGYWRDERQTRERFRVCGGASEYLTGDCVVRNKAGAYVFTGRSDHRVKVRGSLVDIATVEAALRKIDGVRDAAVIAVEGSTGVELEALVVAADVTGPALRKALSDVVPEYWIPARIELVDALPRTISGKVDRTAIEAKRRAHRSGEVDSPMDTLEWHVRASWGRALGSMTIGRDEHFLDVGGNSLKAAQIVVSLGEALKCDLPVRSLAEFPTIRTMAAAIRRAGLKTSPSRIVPLHPGERGQRAPLFCIPGAGSDIITFLPLARYMGHERPVYGIQHVGADGEPQRYCSLEEMASSCLSEVESLAGSHPVLLVGSSFGGVIAFELARQLQKRGRPVGFVGLLDTYGGRYPVLRDDLSIRRRCLVALRWCLPLSNKTELSMRNLLEGLRERWAWLRARMILRAARRGAIAPPRDLRFICMRQVSLRARATYAFPPYDGPVHLFRTSFQPPSILYREDLAMGWGDCTKGGLSIVDIDGEHGPHLLEPHVAGLSEKLSKALREAHVDHA